jgi:hypothetical protein
MSQRSALYVVLYIIAFVDFTFLSTMIPCAKFANAIDLQIVNSLSYLINGFTELLSSSKQNHLRYHYQCDNYARWQFTRAFLFLRFYYHRISQHPYTPCICCFFIVKDCDSESGNIHYLFNYLFQSNVCFKLFSLFVVVVGFMSHQLRRLSSFSLHCVMFYFATYMYEITPFFKRQC